jgi:hypothetical protein
MKTLSLLFSLLLGAAVLVIFVQPWGALEKMLGVTTTREAAPAKPLTPPEQTATVEATPAKPPEAAAPQPATPPPEAPKAAEPADPKAHLLAAEKAEAERNVALEQKAATPLPRETKRYFKVRVRDAGTLEAGLLPTDTVMIKLEGIDAREADETCIRERCLLALWRQGPRRAHPLHPLPCRDLHAAARRRDQGFCGALQRRRTGSVHLAGAPGLDDTTKRRRARARESA